MTQLPLLSSVGTLTGNCLTSRLTVRVWLPCGVRRGGPVNGRPVAVPPLARRAPGRHLGCRGGCRRREGEWGRDEGEGGDHRDRESTGHDSSSLLGPGGTLRRIKAGRQGGAPRASRRCA